MPIPTVLKIKMIARTALTISMEAAGSWLIRFAKLTTHFSMLQHSQSPDAVYAQFVAGTIRVSRYVPATLSVPLASLAMTVPKAFTQFPRLTILPVT